VSNPVEILNRTSRRIAQVAAARTIAYAVLPAIVAIALAMSLRPLGRATWERWGYVLNPAGAHIIAGSLHAIAALSVIAGLGFGYRAYVQARDFVGAAQQVDDVVGGHQQIITFATLADPSVPDSSRGRSPLFPLLWKRAIGFLESFEPERAFPFSLGRPITRSSLLAFGVALVMVLATLGLVHPPSPLQTTVMKLREIASEIEKSSNSANDLALASNVRDAADALENPKLPPEEKKKRLEEVMREMASHGDQKQGGGNQKGQGAGNNPGSKESKGQDKGAGGGSGSSNNSGNGSSGNRAGVGKGEGSKDNNPGKDKNSIELQNELAKAETQIETEESKNPNNSSSAGGEQDKGQGQHAGNNPDDKAAGTLPNPKQPGNVPTQTAEGNRNLPQAGGNNPQAGKDQGSNQGDTHLGEFPAPTKTQRFAQGAGDALNIHDARYVMFRLPGAIPVGPGGVTVLDPNRTRSTTPYVNAPLKETSNDAPPDERQLVPPRYRDLIH
jgi:hypothetical protein